MAIRPSSPEEILRRNRDRAVELAGKAGGPRLRQVLERAQRDLQKRLQDATGLRGPGAGSFTAEQLRVTLEQVRDVLRVVTGGVGQVVVDAGKVAAEETAAGTVQYLDEAERRFRGVNQGLQLREAGIVDSAVMGTESTILRRLGNDPTHPAQAGILQRYGMNVVTAFEETLQQRFLARKPWAEVRQELIASSPFLQGKPMFWAERIVRTEVMNANNRAGWETIRASDEQLGDMLKILCATFDNRTAADSYAVHGQVRRPSEAFQAWQGLYQHPPNRPNDRESVVPHRMSWPLPKMLLQKSDAEVAARWAWEGRKGAPPPRPKMSTVDMDQIGKAAPPKVQPSPGPGDAGRGFSVGPAQEEPRAAAPQEPEARAPSVPPPPPPEEARPAVPPPLPPPEPVRMFPSVPQYDAATLKEQGVEVSGSVALASKKVFAGAAPTLEHLSSMWSANGFTAQISEVKGAMSGNFVNVDATIKAPDGKDAGVMERTFFRENGELKVSHKSFFLHDKHQGKGVGAGVLKSSIEEYQRMGVQEVHLLAGDVGRYTWARFGFQWAPETATIMRDHLEWFLVRKGVEPGRAANIAASVSKRASDVAALELDGKKLGKEFLLDKETPSWQGALRLAEDDPGFKAAKSRLGIGGAPPPAAPAPKPVAVPAPPSPPRPAVPAVSPSAPTATEVPADVRRSGYGESYQRIAAGITDDSLDYLRDPKSFREGSFRTVERVYDQELAKGKTPTEIATEVMDPIRVDMYADGMTVLTDGRHRYTTAREQGASAIRAKVRQYGPRGAIKWEKTMILPLK